MHCKDAIVNVSRAGGIMSAKKKIRVPGCSNAFSKVELIGLVMLQIFISRMLTQSLPDASGLLTSVAI